MKILLHLGTDKTGTTSLQHALAAMRPQLKEAGYHYPKSKYGREEFHHVLTGLYEDVDALWPLLRKKPWSAREAKDYAKGFLDEAVEQAHAENAHTLILSSELLLPNKIKPLAAVSAALKPIADQITPVIYVREPASLYKSRLQQEAKLGIFLRPFEHDSLRFVIEQVEKHFDTRPVIRAFATENLMGRDVVQDFFARVLDLNVEPVPLRQNESLSAEAVCALISIGVAIQQAGWEPRDHALWHLMHKIKMYSDDDGLLSKHDIKPCVEAKIRDRAIDYVWLRDRYGVEFGELDYDNISELREGEENEFRQLSDVVDVNIEKSMALILKSAGQLRPAFSHHLFSKLTLLPNRLRVGLPT